MSEVLVIRNIQVHDINAQQNALIVGSPSPATLCGAALALCRQLDVELVSTAFVIHEFNLHRGHPRFVPQEARKSAASTIDVATGDLRLSLLIEIDRGEAADRFDDAQTQVDALRVQIIRRTTRRQLRNIAGGRVINPPPLDNITLHKDRHAALRAIRFYGGVVLIDRSDLLQGFSDPLAGILDHLAIPKDGEKLTRGWLVPIHVGYQGIEPPVLRKADRKKIDEDIEHCFVECITSLGEYVSSRRLLGSQNCFWRYRHNETERTYYVTTDEE